MDILKNQWRSTGGWAFRLSSFICGDLIEADIYFLKKLLLHTKVGNKRSFEAL